jgi:biopolymer transport protein ExbB
MNWLKAGVDYGIIGLLVLMSIIAVGIALERWFVLRKIRAVDYNDKRAFELYITNNVHLIATIGSNAPYVGLLGTVLGIMLTFYNMGEQGFMDTAKIMTGLALALKSTAAGLLVAIPSIVCYNLLIRKVKVLLLLWDMDHGKQSI